MLRPSDANAVRLEKKKTVNIFMRNSAMHLMYVVTCCTPDSTKGYFHLYKALLTITWHHDPNYKCINNQKYE